MPDSLFKPNSHYNNYYGSILDPLHGYIKLSEIEKWILSQPIFSRLRRIKQNTFLYYVFPSSNHTRFEHSIGVMHLASKVFNSCKENYVIGNKKLNRRLKKEESIFFDLGRLDEERESIYYQELRLAALLHDIGHGPMSHLFDNFAISKDVFLKIIKEDVTFNKYYEGFEDLIDKHGKVEHEIMSCFFIFHLIDNLKKVNLNDPFKFSLQSQKTIDEISSERIVKMIEPKFKGLNNILDGDNNDYTNFFSRIITAFPIDADRMDYLLRDSYFSGVTYGIYDINRVFSSFIPIIDENKQVKLGYKESGSDSMLRFIQSRSHLFNQVYFHKTNRGANTMLQHSTNTVRASSQKLLDISRNASDIIDFYKSNGDEYFLMNTIKNYKGKSSMENEIFQNLIDRKLFKRIYRKRITIGTTTPKIKKAKIQRLEKLKQKIENKLDKLNNSKSNNLSFKIFAAIDISKNENFKDADDDKTVLLIKKQNDIYQYLKRWDDHSLEFKALDLTTITVRVYINQSFENPKEFEKISNFIMSHIEDDIKKIELIN